MAKAVYETRVIELQDGTSVTLKPLALGKQRLFMKEWGRTKEFDTLESEDEVNDLSYEIYINCSGICLGKQFEERFEEPVSKAGVLSEEFREYLEDVIDNPTAEEILSVCGGLRLNDPKYKAAMEEAMYEALRGKN